MGNPNSENGVEPLQVKITIPDNTGTGASIRDLLALGGFAAPERCSIEISKMAPGVSDTTERGAFVVASRRRGAAIASTDFTTHGRPVPAGEAYYAASDKSLDGYVRSTTAATVDALVIILE